MVLAFVVGKRTQANANLLLKRVQHVSDGYIPFFTSDQLAAYPVALLSTYGQWVQPERKGNRGPQPKPQQVAPDDLLYAQVVKRREKGQVVEVTYRIVFGHQLEVEQRLQLSPVSQAINTSFVERDNLTLRQSSRRLTRKTNGFSKEIASLEKQLWIALACYHFVLPHHSLRSRLSEPMPTRGSGSHKCWQPVTPAMAAGITDHVWSTSELLSYRVSPEFLGSLNSLTDLFPSWYSLDAQK